MDGFINKFYWNIYVHLFKYCIWLFLYYSDRVEWLQHVTYNAETLLSGSLQKKFADLATNCILIAM